MRDLHIDVGSLRSWFIESMRSTHSNTWALIKNDKWWPSDRRWLGCFCCYCRILAYFRTHQISHSTQTTIKIWLIVIFNIISVNEVRRSRCFGCCCFHFECFEIVMLFVTLTICPAFSIRHFISRLTFSLVIHFLFVGCECQRNNSFYLCCCCYNTNIWITIALVINTAIKET